ncbi:hypothetical protein LCGC14_0853070 [marine sediment metagenome]|uniref:Uncharacterized protein n=1 Tax=marine sediment metagenome TaxID=412755 RepID=A0A0F9P9N2_9ZZZZ
MITFPPMTKEELAAHPNVPQVYKDAMEEAIRQWSGLEEEDRIWPDYFRGDRIGSELGSVLNDGDVLKDDEYQDECIAFQTGWKLREQLAQAKLC